VTAAQLMAQGGFTLNARAFDISASSAFPVTAQQIDSAMPFPSNYGVRKTQTSNMRAPCMQNSHAASRPEIAFLFRSDTDSCVFFCLCLLCLAADSSSFLHRL
jgi:hypothetical protein